MPVPFPHVREAIRKATMPTPKRRRTSPSIREEDPLLGARADQANGHGDVYNFFLNSHATPGTASPKRRVRWPALVWHIVKATLLSSYVNIFLVFVPIGIVAGVTKWDPVVVFVLNFFAIIPLAAILSFATEEISANLGDALGGLLNATFGNAVELIVSVIALKAEEYDVVKSSMIGSILSNLLLVMGMCFVFGGIVNMRDSQGAGTEQSFQAVTAQTTCSLMTLAAASMIIPGALSMVIDAGDTDRETNARTILHLSRGTAVLLLLIYVLYLNFQLKTHHNLFAAEDAVDGGIPPADADEAQRIADREEAGDEKPTAMSPWAAGGVLIFTTILVSVCADYLVGSIDSLVERANISRNFIGLILIPIVGNAAEHVTAVVVAIKNKMDLAMGVAIGSSIQISLFVTPFLVCLGWIMNKPMTLKFETFETVAFALSVLVVTYTVQDGKSNYLEGAMLMSLYIIIAVAFFVTPSEALAKGGF